MATKPNPTQVEPASATPRLRLRGLSKHYGGVAALRDVTLDLRAGEVMALFGHNGAGKSTLIKTLAGAEVPDAGTVEIDGEEVDTTSPRGALEAGIRVVYQELSLFGELSVAENMLSGSRRAAFLDRRSMVKECREHLETMGLNVDPTVAVESLALGEQQMVEIGRALFSGAKVVVLDEPTSALSPSEAKLLFEFVSQMSSRGITFILISHFLDEIMDNADRVTVMRSGTVVDTVPVEGLTAAALVHLALGEQDVREGTFADVERQLPTPVGGKVVARATSADLEGVVRGLDLEIGEGEIVALYGELGCGHEDVAEALFGARRVVSGSLEVLGQKATAAGPVRLRRAGVGYVPADRRSALALEQPIYRNVTLAALDKVCPWFVRVANEHRVTKNFIERLGIRGASATKEVGLLSGGNQQKVLISRWLVDAPKLLVLAEPTRGMDVGAKTDVLKAIEQARDEGASILLVTSEPETAVALGDRILTMRRGVVTRTFQDESVRGRDLLEAVA
ncbi:MAG: sugar ABC transporter ATP-binding protein [Arthrobacter sp.]|nr:sugar ABC transporter ATP-binding protein [Arthrobacter sp.]